MSIEVPKLLKDFSIYLTTIRGKSKKTRQEYQYDLRLLLRFLRCIREDIHIDRIQTVSVQDVDIDFIKEISLEELYAFLEYCEEVRKNSPSARARKVASIKSLFKYLTNKRRLLDFNPAEELESPKIGVRSPIYMELEEAETFLSGIKEGNHYYRDTCMMTFLLNLGLRVSELCGLNLNSIQGETIRIVGKGNKERILPLNEGCLEALSNYESEERYHMKSILDKEAIFISQKGTRINKRTIQRLVKKVNVQSGLNKEKVTPHKLRHTAATLIYKEKSDIRSLQYILGHESVSTTQVYTHIDSNQIKELLSVNPLNKKKHVKLKQ